ncbi:hypothetical protein ACFL1X_13690 [Candidatus Hydrogenedentota bacterium]
MKHVEPCTFARKNVQVAVPALAQSKANKDQVVTAFGIAEDLFDGLGVLGAAKIDYYDLRADEE